MTQESKCIEHADGTREWWLNEKLHRTDGPAVEHADGSRMWWLNGISLTFNVWLKKAIFDKEEQVMFKLIFG